MPPSNPSFTTVSDQDDHDMESFNIDGGDTEHYEESNSNRSQGYVYVRPFVKYVLAGIALIISAVVVFSVTPIAPSQKLTEANWKPTRVDPAKIDEYLDQSRFLEKIEFDEISGLKSGTYLQKAEMVSDSNGSVMGQDISSHTDAEVDSTMLVKELSDGEKEISVTLTRFKMDANSMGTEMHYDSDVQHEDDEVSNLIDSLIGKPTVMTIDKDNNIIQADESKAAEKLDLSHSDQYNQISRAAEALPPSDQVVQPSDNWDFQGMNMEGFAFSGTSSLLGYMQYDGNDVAVVKFQGRFDIDYQELMDEMLDDDAAIKLMNGLTVKDGELQGWLFWDKKFSFARWCFIDMSMVMEMEDPFNESQFFEVPTNVSSESYVALV